MSGASLNFLLLLQGSSFLAAGVDIPACNASSKGSPACQPVEPEAPPVHLLQKRSYQKSLHRHALNLTQVDPIPVPLKSCAASSEYNKHYVCEKTYDGEFGVPDQDKGSSWATKGEGTGSWIKLEIDEPRKIDTLLYTNRRSFGDEENKDVELKFSAGKPAAITLKKTALNDHTLYSYCFPEVTTSFVKVLVKSHYSKSDNGAEEIAFVYTQGDCPNMLKENAEPLGEKDPTGAGPQGGGYYKPEPKGGNIPNGEIVPTTKTKCVAKCAANPLCKAWNFRLKDSRCTLKGSTDPGFQPDPKWISGEKGSPEVDPIPVPLKSCTASSERNKHYVCDNTYDGKFGKPNQDKQMSWATKQEGTGSWIKLDIDEPRKVDTLLYTNRRSYGDEENKDVELKFSEGKPAAITLKKTALNDHTLYSYCFPEVTTSFVKILVKSHYSKGNNGAEEIAFVYTKGDCPNMLKENAEPPQGKKDPTGEGPQGGGYYKPEPNGGNIPDGEIVPTTKTKCVAKCAANPACKAWNFRLQDSRCTLKGSTDPGFQPDPKWVSGEKGGPEADPIPVPLKSCTASTEYNKEYVCENTYDGEFGKPQADKGVSWATKNEGTGSWIKLDIDEPRKVDTLLYTNRRSFGKEENKDVELKFSAGKPAAITLKKTAVNDHTLYSYCFPEVTTSFVKMIVKSHYSKADNGAEEIAFVYTQGDCPNMLKENAEPPQGKKDPTGEGPQGGGYYKPEPNGGNLPDGEIVPTTKTKCVAKCAANPACKAWNFRLKDSRCTLKGSTDPGFQPDPKWVSGEKGAPEVDPIPVPLKSCAASSERSAKYVCANTYDGKFGKPRDDKGVSWATKKEGKGSWIKLDIDKPRIVDTMLYTNRRSYGDEENKDVMLKFSAGKPAPITLKKTALHDHSLYSYCFPEVTTSFVKMIVKSHYSKGDNGAEEIAFVYTKGDCPEMSKENAEPPGKKDPTGAGPQGGGYYKPEPEGGNIPDGEIVPTTKTKCVAKCAANPACKAWNFRLQDSRCTLKGSTDPGFQPDPKWVSGKKDGPEAPTTPAPTPAPVDPIPVPLKSCAASSEKSPQFKCENTYDGKFGKPKDDKGVSWATKKEGTGSWIKLDIDEPRIIDTMLYTNRRSIGDEENKDVLLKFSAGKPAPITLKKTALHDHSLYSYCFPEVTTSFVKMIVKSHYSKGDNGAEEIAFVYTKGDCPNMLKENAEPPGKKDPTGAGPQGGGYYKPEPTGGNLPNGEIVPTTKTKCVAKCAANPACAAWNFRLKDSRCTLKGSTDPGFQPDPEWVSGEKGGPEEVDPIPVPLKSCSASSEKNAKFVCENTYDGKFGKPKDDKEVSWATKKEGKGSWIKLDIDEPRIIDTMLYTNRRSHGDEENKDVQLKFSAGKPAPITLKKTALHDHSLYSYCFPEVTTSFVKMIVESHYSKGDNGAEEIAFVYTKGDCPEMSKENAEPPGKKDPTGAGPQGGGYYKPEPTGGNLPNGEIAPTTKTKCVAKCAANPACAAWNFRLKDSRCTLKGSTDPGFQPDPEWVSGKKDGPEEVDPIPVPLESCTASSELNKQYVCEKTYDGEFGKPGKDKGTVWATKGEGAGSWIKLDIDEPRMIDTMLYTNRRSQNQDEENKDVELKFSEGKPAPITLKKTALNDHSFYSYCFPEVTTSFVKIMVKSHYGKKSNGAEEIAFVYAQGDCPNMLKENAEPKGKKDPTGAGPQGGGYYKPEPKGGNLPNGEFVPTTKAKCVAKCAANPACKAWNFRLRDSRCTLKGSTEPGFQPDPKWVSGEKGDPIPVPLKSCTASSELSNDYVCEKTYDGEFGAPQDDKGKAWATKGEGAGSWVKLDIDKPRTIDTMLYTNRRSMGDEENKIVQLKFSEGEPAKITLKKTALNDHTLYAYCFPEVTTSFVKVNVGSHYSKGNNGAEEIAFVYARGDCPDMLKENAEPPAEKDPTGAGPQGGGFYKPEPKGGNIPDGVFVPTTKTKCVAKCAANPACKAWNFRLKDSRCTLKGSTEPGFQPDPKWVSGEKAGPEVPVPAIGVDAGTTCKASSQNGPTYDCANTYDGNFGTPSDDAGKAWATKGEGKGSWITLTIDEPRGIDTMLYTNRRSFGDEENKEVRLKFSSGKPAKVTLKKTDLNDHTFYSYSFPKVTATSVKIVVKSHYAKDNNGAEEIAFINSNGQCPENCPEMAKENAGYYKPEPNGGNLPDGEIVPTTKAKCVAMCAADPACKAWNFKLATKMCHLKDSTDPGFQPDPEWIAGAKGAPAPPPEEVPVPAIGVDADTTCTASSSLSDNYDCPKSIDGKFGQPGKDSKRSWASKGEGTGSWIKLTVPESRDIDMMLYTNRRSMGDEENKEVQLTFSAGKPATITLKKTALDDHTFYGYCFPEVTTSFVKLEVLSHYAKGNNGAEEIAFIDSDGECPEMEEEKGGYFEPEPNGGNIPDGEIEPTSKAKCVALCAADPGCKAWNFKKKNSRCTLKKKVGPFKKNPKWICGTKADDEVPVPAIGVDAGTTCSASSTFSNNYDCPKTYDGAFGEPGKDAGKAWASKGEGAGSWIKLDVPASRTVDTMLYTNRRSNGDDENKEVRLKFSDGKPATITLKKTELNDHSFYSYCFPKVTTSFVKVIVKSHYSKGNNGAEEIAFVNSNGQCPKLEMQEEKGGYYKPEPEGGNIPNGELAPTTKAKCVARCAANPACKAWNFRVADSMCHLKRGKELGIEPDPKWICGEKGEPEAPVPAIGIDAGTTCTASSQFDSNYECANTYDGRFGDKQGDAGKSWATKSEGQGSWIKLTIPAARSIDTMLYTNRRSIEDSENKDVKLQFSAGKPATITLKKTELDDHTFYTYFFPSVTTTFVKIGVLTHYTLTNNGAEEIAFVDSNGQCPDNCPGMQQEKGGYFKPEPEGGNIPGGEYVPSSKAHCVARCAADPACKAWNFRIQDGMCHLKRSAEMGFEFDPKWVAGEKGIDEECMDKPGWTDEKGNACKEWIGYDCNTAVKDWKFSEDGQNALLANCKATCGLCDEATTTAAPTPAPPIMTPEPPRPTPGPTAEPTPAPTPAPEVPVTAEPCTVPPTTTAPPFDVPLVDDGSVRPLRCSAHGKPLELIKRDGAFSIRELDIDTGIYTKLMDIPYELVRGFFSDINACGISPADGIMYCSMHTRLASYIVRLSPGVIEFVAKLNSWIIFNSGGFNSAGTDYYLANSTAFFVVVDNVHRLPGFRDQYDAKLTDLTQLPMQRPNGWFGCADVITFKKDFNKDGTDEEYVASLAGPRMQIARWDGARFTESYNLPISLGWWDDIWGAGWNFYNKIFFANNGGKGVYEVMLDDIVLGNPRKNISLRKVGDSERQVSNDGMSCPRAADPWATRITPFDCDAHPAPLQLVHTLGGVSVMKLNLLTGQEIPIYNLPWTLTTPNFVFLNGAGLNPKDHIPYACLMNVQAPGGMYIVRFDENSIEYVAKLAGRFNPIAGTFDASGNFFFHSHPDDAPGTLYKVVGLDEMVGYKDINDPNLADLTQIPGLQFDDMYQLADIVALQYDSEGTGTLVDYILGINRDQQVIVVKWASDWPSQSQVWRFRTNNVLGQYQAKLNFGAAWNFNGRLMFASNDGVGVFEALSFDSTTGVVQLGEIGKSTNVEYTDGFNCPDASPFWGNATLKAQPTVDLLKF